MIRGTTRRSSQKTTFCVIDTNRVSTSLVHAEGQRYTRCGQNDRTGLSVGWGDRYGWELAGQEIDISGQPDGYYWLVSTVDFQRRLTETNDANNCAAAKIEIRGTYVYDRVTRFPARRSDAEIVEKQHRTVMRPQAATGRLDARTSTSENRGYGRGAGRGKRSAGR